jgi:transcriptional regulator with XRE-family HTH domain
MQQKDDKTKHLAKIIGQVVNELRIKKKKGSINQFAHEYDLDVGNTSRIENGLIDAKVVTLWKIAEALEMPLSELIKQIEAKIGNDFQFFEE